MLLLLTEPLAPKAASSERVLRLSPATPALFVNAGLIIVRTAE